MAKSLPSFHLSFNQAYVELRVGVKRHAFFAYVAKSKTRSKKKQVINLDQDVQVCGAINIFFFFLWMVYELLFMNHPFSFIFLGCGLSFSLSLSLTFLVGMWHTFLGYASFF